MIKFFFVVLLAMPFNAIAQDLSVFRSDNKGVGFFGKYWSSGDPDTRANLILYYEIPISKLRIESSSRVLLEDYAKSLCPDIFGDSQSGLNESKARALAQRAKVNFRLTRGRKLYAICESPKNTIGYVFSCSWDSTSGGSVSVGSYPLPVNQVGHSGASRPLKICKDPAGHNINPVVRSGDTIILQQGERVMIKGQFE